MANHRECSKFNVQRCEMSYILTLNIKLWTLNAGLCVSGIKTIINQWN